MSMYYLFAGFGAINYDDDDTKNLTSYRMVYKKQVSKFHYCMCGKLVSKVSKVHNHVVLRWITLYTEHTVSIVYDGMPNQ